VEFPLPDPQAGSADHVVASMSGMPLRYRLAGLDSQDGAQTVTVRRPGFNPKNGRPF
jgi:hypothetical protein